MTKQLPSLPALLVAAKMVGMSPAVEAAFKRVTENCARGSIEDQRARQHLRKLINHAAEKGK